MENMGWKLTLIRLRCLKKVKQNFKWWCKTVRNPWYKVETYFELLLPNSGEKKQNTVGSVNKFEGLRNHLSNVENPPVTFHYTGWLKNAILIMFLQSLYNWVVSSLIYPKQSGAFFSLLIWKISFSPRFRQPWRSEISTDERASPQASFM